MHTEWSTVVCVKSLWWLYFRQGADKEKWPTWKAAARRHNHGWLWLRPHDCLPDGVECNVPPFLVSRQQLEPDEVVRARHTATLSIHVERAIERVKKFQITHFFPAMLSPLTEHIVFVCTFRTLFEDPEVLCLPESKWCWSCDGHSVLSVIWHGLELYHWLVLHMSYSCSCFGPAQGSVSHVWACVCWLCSWLIVITVFFFFLFFFTLAQGDKGSSVKCVLFLNPYSGRKGVGGSSQNPNFKIRFSKQRQLWPMGNSCEKSCERHLGCDLRVV